MLLLTAHLQPLAQAQVVSLPRRSSRLRKRIAAILRARAPTLSADSARDRAIVVLQLIKAASSLNDEEGLSGRSTALREIKTLATHYLEQREANKG